MVLLPFIVVIAKAQGCAYAGEGGCAANLIDPTPLAVRVVGDVCRKLNIQQLYVFQASVQNACASNLADGTPIITYNNQFLNNLYQQNSWAPVSVLAHEVGHHYNADATWFGQFSHPWTRELRADFVSGYVLFKLGASLEDSQSAFRIIFSAVGSESHPDTPTRMQALAAGYLRAYQGF